MERLLPDVATWRYLTLWASEGRSSIWAPVIITSPPEETSPVPTACRVLPKKSWPIRQRKRCFITTEKPSKCGPSRFEGAHGLIRGNVFSKDAFVELGWKLNVGESDRMRVADIVEKVCRP